MVACVCRSQDVETFGASVFIGPRPCDVFEHFEAFSVGGVGEVGDAALWDDVVWIASAESGRLEQVGDVLLCRALAIDHVVVACEADGAAEHDLVGMDGEATVLVAEGDFHVG